MVSYNKGGTQAKGIRKQDPGGEYLGLIGIRMGNGESFTMDNFIVWTVHLIHSYLGRLSLEGWDGQNGVR